MRAPMTNAHASMFGAEAGPPNGATHVKPPPGIPGGTPGPITVLPGDAPATRPKGSRVRPGIPGGTPGPIQLNAKQLRRGTSAAY